jgi:hypothetical protein
MVDSQIDFQKRLSKLGRKHRAMDRGYKTKMRSDGLIVVKPKRAKINFPFKGLLIVAAAFFVFKAFMLASFGEVTYQDRVDQLNAGSVFEKGGAWVMQIEPVTAFIAGKMDPYI